MSQTHRIYLADQPSVSAFRYGAIVVGKKTLGLDVLPDLLTTPAVVAWRLVDVATEQPRAGALVSGIATFELRAGVPGA